MLFLCHEQWIKHADAHRTQGEAVAWDTCHSIANPLVLIDGFLKKNKDAVAFKKHTFYKCVYNMFCLQMLWTRLVQVSQN